MLASKLCVYTTDHILNNASKFSLCKHHLNPFHKTLPCNQTNKSDSNISKNRTNPYDACKRNAEELLRHCKKANYQCSKTDLKQCGEQKKPLHKCETITIVSEYEEARKQVNDLIEGIKKFFDEEKEAIVGSLKKKARVDKDDTCRWLKNISDSIDEKLQQLVEFDSSFGSQIRITVLRFKDHARNTFISLHCELAPSVKQIESMLDKIQAEISERSQKAAVMTLVCSCKGSPSVFKKCILDNMTEAKNILKQTKCEAKTKLWEVKKHRDYILKCHKEALDEGTYYHASEMQALSRYLEDCLVALKKLK